MAQVIRKYLEGGKTKPIIIKVDGKDYNYDDIEKDVWGNFDAYALQQGWNNDTLQAVREYLDYALPGLKNGALTYGHNVMNGVSEEWQSNGSLNRSGKGIFAKDITNDKRAGATLGTAFLNRLFTDIIPEYKVPELKSIGSLITQDIAKKIIDNNFGGNETAFAESWARLTPSDRYTIFRLAVSDLNYSEDEYKDVATFNTNRDALLLALGGGYDEANGLSKSILDAYGKLGGYGLETFIKGETKLDTTSETKVPTIEDKRKEWREEAINAGYHTDQAIADYIATKEMEYNQLQSLPGTVLKKMLDLDLFTKAHESLDNYIKNSKGLLWKNYRFNRGGVDIDNEKLKRGDNYNFSKFSESSFRNQIKLLSLQLRLGKVNAFMWRGVLSRLMSHPEAFRNLLYEYKDGSGKGCYIIPGTEDMDSESVITYTTTGGLAIKSIHDFPELYANRFNNKFRELYKQQYNFDLPEDWDIQLNSAITQAEQQSLQTLQVLQSKQGGILKAQDGTAFTRARVNQLSGFDLESNYWNQVHQLDAQKKLLEIDEANQLGVTVEELRKGKAEEEKKLVKIDEAVKHGKSTTEGFKDYDIAGLVGLGGDIVETVGSISGGAFNPATIIGGLTSLGAYTYADIKDPRVSKWGVAGNLAGNLLLSGAGLIPEVGAAATAARLAKRALKYGPALVALAKDVPEMVEPVNKLISGKSLTNDDWMAIANGIRAISTGTRMTHHAKNTLKYTTKGDTKYLIKTNEKGWQDISKSEYDKLSNKKASELSGILSEERMKEIGILNLRRNHLTPWKNESRKVQVREQQNPRRLKTYEEVKNDYGRVSKAYTNMVRDALQMLNLGLTLRNNRFTKWLGNIGYKSNVSPGEFYKLTGLWGGKTSKEVPMFLNPESAKLKEKVLSDIDKGFARMKISELEGKLNSVLDSMRKVPLGIGKSKAPTLVDMNKALATRAKNLLNGNKSELKAYIGKEGKVTLVVDKNLGAIYDRNKLISIDTPIVTENGERITLAEAFANGKLVKYDPDFLKRGGSIFLNNVLIKYQRGGSIPKYATGDLIGTIYNNGLGTDWYNTIGSQYENDLFTALENESDPIKRLELVDYINKMQDLHYGFYKQYNGSLAYYDPEVGKYLQSIIDKNSYVNQKGIINGRNKNRYADPKIRTVGTDYDKNHNFAADSYYGGLTDDRRLLGRMTTTSDDKTKLDKYVNDYTDELIASINNRLKGSNLEMYLDPNTNYYKLRTLGSTLNPSLESVNNPSSSESVKNPSLDNGITITDPMTGETLQQLPDGTFKAVGNSNAQTKSTIGKVGDDIWKYLQNINPADAIALGRAIWGEDVNNKVADITKKMGTALLDPQYQTAILHGNYNAKMLAELLAGKINAAALRPISSDAGLQLASKLEAALKAQRALELGNAEDSEMYWKTLLILNQVNNENAAQEVATGNENRSRIVAAANNRLQAEAARLSANFELIWQPYLAGVELNYRNEDTLRRQAEIDAWKYAVTDKYQQLNDEVMTRYRNAYNTAVKDWASKHNNSMDGFNEWWTTDNNGSRKYLKEISDISRAMHKELYEGLSGYYGYTPFLLKRAPETTQVWRTPGINPGLLHYGATYNKSGGTLSAAERQALKTTNEINKNIRAANRETFKNIRQDKREHRKALALVSQLSADLIKKAIGI